MQTYSPHYSRHDRVASRCAEINDIFTMHRLFVLRLLICLFGVALSSARMGHAQTQSYPSKPLKLIVPFPPGAGTDAVARLVAQKLGEQMNATIVVDNRTGAGGAIGAEQVAHADPDGYTLLFVASPFTTVAAASATPGYDPVRQFAGIALIATGPLVFVTGPAVPVASMRELIALARAKPGMLNYGSAGSAGINHLALELLKVRTGIEIVHVPYKGIGPATIDLLSGQIQLLTGTVPAVVPYVSQGRLKALAVTGAKRSPLLPEAPTMHEVGVADYEVYNYWGIVAPASTPRDIIVRLNAEVQKMLATPEVRDRLERDGVELTPGGPERMQAFIASDLAAWRKLIAEAKLVLE
jgi:tripartite-type tricarboxylate transporter receptor subunit TctC